MSWHDIPKIPTSLADTAERYTNFRRATLDSWNPVKREMLITTRFADTSQVHVVKMPGGARTQLTFYPDSVARALYSPAKEDSFVFVKDVGGGEFYQLYRYDVQTGEAMLLTDGKSRNTDPIWSYAGDKVVYGSTRRTGNDVDLYVMDPMTPNSDHVLVQLQGGGWSANDWSPDSGKILVTEQISANESYLWIVDSGSGKKDLVTPKGGGVKVAYGDARFSKDGKGIHVTTDKESEFQRTGLVDLASKQHTYLTSPLSWDVDEFALSYDGKTITFVVNEEGYGVLHLLDTRTGKEQPVGNLPKGIVHGLARHKNNRDLGFTFTSVDGRRLFAGCAERESRTLDLQRDRRFGH